MRTRRMRNILFYILLISAVTHSFAKNEERKEKENLTEDDFEEEARKDIEDLLTRAHEYSDEDDEKTQVKKFNELQSVNERNLIEQVDQLLKKVNEKTYKNAEKTAKQNLRFEFHADDLSPAARDLMNNVGFGKIKNFKTRNSKVIIDEPSHSNKNNRYEHLMQKFLQTHSDSVKKQVNRRDKVKHHDSYINYRKRVNYVNLKPEVYPELDADENKSDNDALDLLGSIESDLNNKDITKVRTPAIKTSKTLLTRNYDDFRGVLENLLREKNRSHTTRTQLRLDDILLNPENKVKKRVSKDSHNSKVHLLRTSDNHETNNVYDLGELVNHLAKKRFVSRTSNDRLMNGLGLDSLINNGRLQALITKIYTENRNDGDYTYVEEIDPAEKTMRSMQTKVTYKNKPIPTGFATARHGRRGSRNRRSTFTQAGYTQDPDTCKTYNENLVKLWANLSKLINVTGQPSERALHNIAMMIQAYLEHQNTKQQQPPEVQYKVKHEESRDRISKVILRIKKSLDEGEGSPERITKIISKYIKPSYGDVENSECQKVNEEYLVSTVGLLYKNYLENAECRNDGDGIVRNKKMSRRKFSDKLIQPLSGTWPSSSSDLNKDLDSILIEDEMYKDFHRGKMPRQRPTTKYRRRVYKRSRKQNLPTSMYRSGDKNMNKSEKVKTQSKIARSRKHRKSSLKSDLGKCERYATRKLTVSLRPVIERFMGLLECQLDNTLRSLNNDRVSMSPYLLYASKFYSNEDSRHQKQLPNIKLTRKNTQRSRNMSPRKSQPNNRYVNSDEIDFDDDNNDDDYDYNLIIRNNENNSPWFRKYSLDKITGIKSGLPAVTRASNLRETNQNNINNIINNDYLTNSNEYFQSPPLYDDYGGIYKTHDANAFPSLINPLMSVNNDKNNVDKASNKIAAEPSNEQAKENERNNAFYEDFPGEPHYSFNISEQQTDPNQTDVSSAIDLTLRDNDQLKDDSLPISEDTVKSFESITEFLKNARDTSLHTPEFAVPFALDSKKGYVELTHLIKYPKILVYRPQFIVKNTMPYDDFLKTISNFNMTNDEVSLMKIVRHLPDSTVKVLFETEDFDSPLEIRNIKEFRRSSLTIPSANYQLGSRIDTENKYGNTDFVDAASYDKNFVPDYRDGVNSNGEDVPTHLDESNSDEQSNSNIESNLDSNSTVNSAPKSPSESSPSSGLLSLASGLPIIVSRSPNLPAGLPKLALGLPKLASEFMSRNTSLSSDMGDVGSAVGSAVGSKIGSGIDTGLDTALDLGSKLNPINPSQFGSYLSKLLLSHSKSAATPHPISQSLSNVQPHTDLYSNPDLNSHPHSHLASSTNIGSKPFIPETAHNVPEFVNIPPSSTQSSVNWWWKKWKSIFKGKLKKIVGKMATIANTIDHIVKL